jgi:chemotaxis protein CheC
MTISEIAPDRFADAFRRGAEDASAALSKWLGRPATLCVERLDALPISAAAAVLGSRDEPICGCAMRIDGVVRGLLLLATADAAGLALADTLLERPVGTSVSWDDLERSAVVETANIVGCAYLNAICAALEPAGSDGILPSPPLFIRDFPAVVMEAILLEQPFPADTVLLARTEFRIAGTPVECGLVFLPDATGLAPPQSPAAGPRGRP